MVGAFLILSLAKETGSKWLFVASRGGFCYSS